MTETTQDTSETSAALSSARPRRKVLAGIVTSAKGNKSLVVRVDRTSHHPLYKKILRLSKKYYVHDETNSAVEGDQVEIMGCRPISKSKSWRLVRILGKPTSGGEQ